MEIYRRCGEVDICRGVIENCKNIREAYSLLSIGILSVEYLEIRPDGLSQGSEKS